MFRKNTCHRQPPLTSHVDERPEPPRKRLKNAWAETFYQECFGHLDEEPFAMLYADAPSRSNVPVNVRVHRMLSEEDRERYADLLAPYLKGHPGHYVYRDNCSRCWKRTMGRSRPIRCWCGCSANTFGKVRSDWW